MASGLPQKPYGKRLLGAERTRAAIILRERYDLGESIRQLAADSGYSIGLVRKLLLEADVEFRPKGGSRWKKTYSENDAGRASQHIPNPRPMPPNEYLSDNDLLPVVNSLWCALREQCAVLRSATCLEARLSEASRIASHQLASQ
jgi:Helix-turn-helix domain